MTRFLTGVRAVAASAASIMFLTAWSPVRSAGQCCGDCNGDGKVMINELVTAVNRALTGCDTPTPLPTLTVTPTSTPVALVDNGDGTITDPNTGLMWEKKSADGGIHTADNVYTWSVSGAAPDGTAFTVFLATLNAPPCFAGHCDWRLPKSGGDPSGPDGSSGEPAEMESILAADLGSCDGLPCVLPIFDTDCVGGCAVTSCSCARAQFYWSSTTYAGNPNDAWGVYFDHGDHFHVAKTYGFYVRAVRDL